MSFNQVIQVLIFLFALALLAKPLGSYIALIFSTDSLKLPLIGKSENIIYKICGIDPEQEMSWKDYSYALLIFNAVGIAFIYILQRMQELLPINPQSLAAVSADSAFNTAISFASNTNWQGYGGESTMSYLTQMIGLGVQNFLSAATGIAVLVAVIRGFNRQNSFTIGNFWTDLTKSILYVLLPLSFFLAIFLVSQGVVQSFNPYQTAKTLQATTATDGSVVDTQTIPLGPVASQIAIKQLGTNGGGFFNTNSAHPFENPTPLSNFIELLCILLIPAALCITFGILVKDSSQGIAIFSAMTFIFLLFLLPCIYYEQTGSPALSKLGVISSAEEEHPGGNMEGKEVRFGITNSALWAVSTTAASNGSVNSMHDSYTAMGGMMPLILMQLGEVVFGGVGSGLYGMLAFVILTVFVAGLMVGRTPEYLGKKIESFEMKMVSIIILLPCALTLITTALAVSFESGTASVSNPGPHAFSQLLYAYSSMSNNNGSAFGGLSANIPYHNLLGGSAMFLSRYWIIIPMLALAGSLARKKTVPPGAGTLPTNTPLFVVLLISVVLIVGALSFIPSLALGPVAEHLFSN